MNRYLFLHRIQGPVMILVFGVTALLDQWDILSFGKSWPLYLIALGLLKLAERAAWSQAFAPDGYTQPYTGQPGNWGGPSGSSAPPPPSSTALSITPPDEGRR
jgi:hypothetical protein